MTVFRMVFYWKNWNSIFKNIFNLLIQNYHIQASSSEKIIQECEMFIKNECYKHLVWQFHITAVFLSIQWYLIIQPCTAQSSSISAEDIMSADNIILCLLSNQVDTHRFGKFPKIAAVSSALTKWSSNRTHFLKFLSFFSSLARKLFSH